VDAAFSRRCESGSRECAPDPELGPLGVYVLRYAIYQHLSAGSRFPKAYLRRAAEPISGDIQLRLRLIVSVA
jgi:hypothetical protein